MFVSRACHSLRSFFPLRGFSRGNHFVRGVTARERRRMSDYAPRVKIRGYANAITSGDIDMRDEREGHNFLTIIIFWIATLDNNLDRFF